MSDSEVKSESDMLRQAVNRLSHKDFWTGGINESLLFIFPPLVERPWEVDMVLNERRYAESRNKMLLWVRDRPLARTFEKDTYEELSALLSDVKSLLREYDDLRCSPESVLRGVDTKKIEWYEDPTSEQREAFNRLRKMRAQLNDQGVNTDIRDDVIDLLSEFEYVFSTIKMTPEPLDSADCTIFEPVATYLARPELQSSFLNRYFALCLLKILSKEASQMTDMSATADNLLPGTSAARILIRLLGQFGDLGHLASPSTVDGRELKPELREVQRLGIGVPSLLFSLFELILPGQ